MASASAGGTSSRWTVITGTGSSSRRARQSARWRTAPWVMSQRRSGGFPGDAEQVATRPYRPVSS